MSHFIKKCTCGITLETCRCPSKDKTVIIEKKPCTHQTSQITTGEFPKCEKCGKTFISAWGKKLCNSCTPPVTVPVKQVLRLIQLHAEGKHDAVQAVAVEIAEQLDKDNESELAQYILAQYNLIPTWSPM